MGRSGNGERSPATRHHAEMALYRVVRGAIRALPHAGARSLGRGMGDLFYLTGSRRRRIALSNLEIAFPELDAEARRDLARESFRHLGMVLADTLSATRFDLAGLCRRLTLEDWEHLRAAREASREESAGRRGGGLLVVSGHLGCWEVAAWVSGAYFGPLNVVIRPLDNPLLDAELAAIRGRFGNRMIPKRGALRGMIQALGAGGLVGILIDQRVEPRDGIRLPFFGQPALTSPLLAHLSLRNRTPVVPIFCHPEPGGRYRFVVRPPIAPPDPGSSSGKRESEEVSRMLTQRYIAVVEEEIRAHPTTWMWVHQRWRLEGKGGRG